jgi:glycosyltransferase domain-containing protein
MRADPLTIVVPTRNRCALLTRCLNFIRAQHPAIEVIVADSSQTSELEANRAAIAALGARVRHLEFDSSVNLMQKLDRALTEVTTGYACICADDDLIVVDVAAKCAEFLADNPDYSACHGRYLRFSLSDQRDMLLEDWEYKGQSIRAELPEKRVVDMLTEYEAPFYSVQSTTMLRGAIQACDTSPFLMFQELANALWIALSGKIMRLDDVYYLRQAGDSSTHKLSEPYVYLAERFPSMLADFWAMSSAVVDRYLAQARMQDRTSILQAASFGFLLYLYRSIDFLRLGSMMVPRLGADDLTYIRDLKSPSYNPGLRPLLQRIAARGARVANRYLDRLRGARAQPIGACFADREVLVAPALDRSLPTANRSQLRRLFALSAGRR